VVPLLAKKRMSVARSTCCVRAGNMLQQGISSLQKAALLRLEKKGTSIGKKSSRLYSNSPLVLVAEGLKSGGGGGLRSQGHLLGDSLEEGYRQIQCGRKKGWTELGGDTFS